jgi:hypothetical protein
MAYPISPSDLRSTRGLYRLSHGTGVTALVRYVDHILPICLLFSISNSSVASFESTAFALDPQNLPVIRIMRTCTIGCINRELIFC